MKIVFILLISILSTDPKLVSKVNTLKKEAEAAYLNKNYQEAIRKYSYLKDSLGVADPAIQLNLAHAYYQSGDTAYAKTQYKQLINTPSNKIKSIALQQLGVMSKDAGKLEEALQQLKAALKADPSNEGARYDYEVVKKLLEKQKQQQDQNQDQENKEDQQNQDQQNQDQENQEQENQEQQEGGEQEGEQQKQEDQKGSDKEKPEEEKDGEEQENKDQENGEEKEQEKPAEQMTKEKLKEMGMSEEKARQLLEAMRQSEIKYLQQQKKKPTKRPPSGKPDW